MTLAEIRFLEVRFIVLARAEAWPLVYDHPEQGPLIVTRFHGIPYADHQWHSLEDVPLSSFSDTNAAWNDSRLREHALKLEGRLFLDLSVYDTALLGAAQARYVGVCAFHGRVVDMDAVVLDKLYTDSSCKHQNLTYTNFMRKTSAEINEEIGRLRALKPVGPFRHKTSDTLELLVEELSSGVDDTADEWSELDLEKQDLVLAARDWVNGNSQSRPSEGWEGLVEEVA